VDGLPVLGTVLQTAAGTTPATQTPSSTPTAHASAADPTVTVTSSTGLTDGQGVTVSGSGYGANAFGAVVQCSSAPGQPTVTVQGNAVPVSCTNPLHAVKSTDASGAFTTAFTVHTGTVGPPATGTDSAGNDASADAAKYPCPPTPAQQASGVTCVIGYGDTSGDQASAPISFAAAGPSSGGSTSSSATATAGTTGTTGASGTTAGAPTTAGSGGSGGSLASTGAGPGLWATALTGLLLAAAGLVLLASVQVAIVLHRRRRPVAAA
jgi:hypothetical protein